MHTTDPPVEAGRRHRRRELDPQLTFTETDPIPPERLRDALRLLVTWASRRPGGRPARGRNSRHN